MKEFSKKGNLLFYSDAESNSFTVLEEGKGLACKHLITVYFKNGEKVCRENGSCIIKPFSEASDENAKVANLAYKTLGISNAA